MVDLAVERVSECFRMNPQILFIEFRFYLTVLSENRKNNKVTLPPEEEDILLSCEGKLNVFMPEQPFY